MGKNIYTIAETFVGVGGSHLGFKKAGFKTVYELIDKAANRAKGNNRKTIQGKDA